MVVENLNVSPGVLWYSLKPSISLVVVLCLLLGMGVPSFGGSWFESVMISVLWLSFLLVIVLLFVFGLIGWLPMGLYVLLSLPFFRSLLARRFPSWSSPVLIGTLASVGPSLLLSWKSGTVLLPFSLWFQRRPIQWLGPILPRLGLDEVFVCYTCCGCGY